MTRFVLGVYQFYLKHQLCDTLVNICSPPKFIFINLLKIINSVQPLMGVEIVCELRAGQMVLTFSIFSPPFNRYID